MPGTRGGPQAPQGGLLRQWLGPLYVTGVFWYRLHHFAAARLPRWSLPPLVVLFTTIFFVLLRRIRRAIAANLAVALGPCGWRENQRRIFRTMWNLAWSLSERYERLDSRRAPSLSLTGGEHWHEIFDSGAGAVIVTAHIGNWETSFMDPHAAHDRHLHVVREEENNPQAQEFIRELVERQAGGQVTVHFARSDDFALATRLLAALRRGDLVALQGDRPRAGSRTVRAEIFGHPLDLPSGPAALCRAAEVPILPVFSFRTGRLETEVVARPPIRVGRSRDREEDLQTAMQRVAAEIEWAIRRSPFQWFCFRDLWGEGARRRD